VSPLEMADAYATIADGGIRNRATAIEKVVLPDGRVDRPGARHRRREFTDGQAAEVTRALEGVLDHGTAAGMGIGCPAAGKTGTTDNYRDAWFVGYTPNLASAVWVGYPKTQVEMRSVHGITVAGGTFPAGIWHDYMNLAKGSDCNEFPKPSTPAQFSSFYGKHSANGTRSQGGTYYGSPPTTSSPPPSTGGGTGGTGGNGNGGKGYDPRFYASPPQAPPDTQAPGRGNGNGHGNGNSGGPKSGQ
jgi:penicillin-binding protein 1A